jgi:replicative DNA helicase
MTEAAVTASRFRDGRDFILNAPTSVPALWGGGRDVLWASGESLLICGPQGVGKSTILQQLAFARIGVAAPELIGYPVAPAARRVLYVAADRPRQIARSMRRMVTEADGDALAERLIVWEGPPPLDLVRHPEALVEWVAGFDVADVYIDSLKDIMSPLSSDEVGAAYNRAVGAVIAAGVEVVVNHHQRKASGENKKPSSLADVYGSVWIPSGAGSVICLWGQAGDPLVELSHLKQPAEDVGPLDLIHDHDCGRTTRRERPDAWTLLQAATTGGITAKDVATAIYAAPTKADIEKVRRRFERLVKNGHAVVIPAEQANQPNIYRPVARDSSVSDREGQREGFTDRSRLHETPTNTAHATLTHPHAERGLTSPLKERGEREGPGTDPDTDEIDWNADPDDNPGRWCDPDTERDRAAHGYGTMA